MAIEPRLKQLLESWEDLREAGQMTTPENHCRDCPEMLQAFRRVLRQFERLDERENPANDRSGAARGTVSEATARAVRFCVDGEPLRGGMGEVFPARDEELGRTVALKFIQRGKGGLEAERRFRREVAITARLQHPGIVPVYGPAVSDDGRSGYSMRFIAGESLDVAIGRHHAAAAAGESPTRAELLDRFEAVCNTMAYAHRHGVIHRDLKPANVMLGKYGETFVVDWGLAKILADDSAQEAASEELTAMTAPGEDSTGEAFTTTGFAIGTYAYMPPEQAHGDYANLNERADVFALGAMLCKILTGQPPYTGKRVLQMAREADLTACFARLDVSGADAELIALAKRCLEKSATDRPSNAQEVLDAVRAHKAAVEARAQKDRERRVAAEAKAAEEHRRRRVTVALAVSVIAILIVAGAWFWAWQEQRSLRQKNSDNAKALLARLDKLYKSFSWTAAEDLLADADDLVGPEGDADLRKQITEAKQNTAFIKRLDGIRLAEGYRPGQDAKSKYRVAFEENGFDILDGHADELAAKLNASPVKEYVLMALEDWSMREPTFLGHVKILGVVQKARGKDYWTELSQVWENGDALAEVYKRLSPRDRTPAVIEQVARQLEKLGKNAVRPVELGLLTYPADFWLHYFLGTSGGLMPAQFQGGIDRVDARIGSLRAALAIRPGTAGVLLMLGMLHVLKHDYNAAFAELNKALTIDPTLALAHTSLGGIYYEQKEYDRAIKEFKEAIGLDSSWLSSYLGLSDVFCAMRNYDSAIKILKRAYSIDPKDASVQRLLGRIYFYTKKDYDAARIEFERATKIEPENASGLHGLGNTYRELGRLGESVNALRKAHALMPKDADIENDMRFSEAFMPLEQQFPAFRARGAKPKTAYEAIDFAVFAGFKKEYALAYRLYKDAFAKDSKRELTFRFRAANAAIHFAAGEDVLTNPGEAERYKILEQARAWLADNLDALRKLATSDNPTERQKAKETLTDWLEDSNLISVRDPEKLKAMPRDKREAWQDFWAQVRRVVEKLNTNSGGETPGRTEEIQLGTGKQVLSPAVLPAFSPDGRHLAYVTIRNRKGVVVVDGVEGVRPNDLFNVLSVGG